MARRLSPPPDVQRMLFQSLDISRTVKRIEARYSSSGRGRPRYPVRAMLLALVLMYLPQMPSVTVLAVQLDRHPEHRELCGFSGRSPERTTFSKFITRAKPKTIEACSGS